MNKIPGLKADIGFGSAESKLPDWRKSVSADEADPDDEQIETPEDVKAILGFDPAEDDESEDDMMRETLVNRMAQNRCKDRAGLPEGAVENAGTSEGVKKGWQKRRGREYLHPGTGKLYHFNEETGMWHDKKGEPTRSSGIAAHLHKMAAEDTAHNSTMLEQASPSPMLGKYATGKKRAKNSFGSKYEEAKHPRYKGKWTAKWNQVEEDGVKRDFHHAVGEKHGLATVIKSDSKPGMWLATTSYPRGVIEKSEHGTLDEAKAKAAERLASRQPKEASNSGTSEGVKKSWQKRHGGPVAGQGGAGIGGEGVHALLKRDTSKGQWERFPTASPEQLVQERMKDELARRLQKRMAKQAKPMPKAKNSHGELEAGIAVEMEHGGGREAAKKIALDHLREDPKYYSKLKGCGMAK